MNKKNISTLSLLVLSVQAGIRRGVEKAKIKLENEYEPKNPAIKKSLIFLGTLILHCIEQKLEKQTKMNYGNGNNGGRRRIDYNNNRAYWLNNQNLGGFVQSYKTNNRRC
jgi:hypothetical protein